MHRIAIIGNAGGGKSILARELGNTLKIPVFEIDQVQWLPNWHPAPIEHVAAIHQAWIKQPTWVIDGWGSWALLEERFNRADTIIFIDYALRVHYWWATKRQVKATLNRNPDWPPKGCRAFPVTWRLYKLIWLVHTEKRPRLIQLLKQYTGEKEVIHLRSPKELQNQIKMVD